MYTHTSQTISALLVPPQLQQLSSALYDMLLARKCLSFWLSTLPMSMLPALAAACAMFTCLYHARVYQKLLARACPMHAILFVLLLPELHGRCKAFHRCTHLSGEVPT